ncbi:unnamed protein product [Prunus armeniaca]
MTGYPKDKCTKRGHRAVRPMGVTYWVQIVKDNRDMKVCKMTLLDWHITYLLTERWFAHPSPILFFRSISRQDNVESREVGLV